MNKRKMTKTMSLAKTRGLSTGWDDFMRRELSDPARARTYLEVAIDEFRASGDGDDFLEALRYLAKAKGGIAEVARKTGFNRESLYRTLSRRGNPQFRTVLAVINALGMQLKIEPAPQAGILTGSLRKFPRSQSGF